MSYIIIFLIGVIIGALLLYLFIRNKYIPTHHIKQVLMQADEHEKKVRILKEKAKEIRNEKDPTTIVDLANKFSEL